MLLRFTKMHGLGNDFVVINLVTQSARIDSDMVRLLADRHLGIGCDQVLLIEPPQDPQVDFLYRIFNSDGSEVEQCGNGARCFARFVLDNKLTVKKNIRVETCNGIMELRVNDDDSVTVDMGIPKLNPADVPFDASQFQAIYPLEVNGNDVELSAVSMGNPHAVLLVDDIEQAPVRQLGEQIETHPAFPNRVNVGFVQVVSPSEIHLRVFERGAGETQACGSGACAAVVAGNLRKLLDSKVTVHLAGGDLEIEWPGEGENLLMTGPAATVYRGQIKL